MAKLLKFDVTVVSSDGTRKQDIVEVAERSRLRAVLKQAKSQGFDFGQRGMLSINSVPIPPNQLSTTLEGTLTRNATIVFVHDPKQRYVVDLSAV